MTFYLHERASLDPRTTAGLRQRGHSLSIHPFAEPFSAPTMDETLGRHLAAFEARFGGRPRTVRHHRLQWLGWAEQAGLEHRHGLADGPQLHHGPPVAQRVPLRRRAPAPFVAETARCSRCGSSRPTSRTTCSWAITRSRWASTPGKPAPSTTTCCDGALAALAHRPGGERAPRQLRRLQRGLGPSPRGADGGAGVPIWDAERWLRFTQARAAVCPRRPLPLPGGGPAGAGPGWRIDVPRGTDEAGLMLLLPLRFAGQELRAPADGPELDLFGWRYRGVALRGAPAVFDALYAPEGRAKAGPSGADPPPVARPPPGRPRAPPRRRRPSGRASPAARPLDGTFTRMDRRDRPAVGTEPEPDAAGHGRRRAPAWRARAAAPPRWHRPAPSRSRTPRRPRRGARRPPSRRRAVRSHRRRSAAGGGVSHPEATREGPKRFFVEWFGGDRDFSDGLQPGLGRRHQHLFVSPKDAAAWLRCMRGALDASACPRRR